MVFTVSNKKGIPCIHVPEIILYVTLQNSDNSKVFIAAMLWRMAAEKLLLK